MSGYIKMENLNDYFAFLKGRTITDSHTSYITVGIAAGSGALTFEKYHCNSPTFDGTARDVRLEIDSVISDYKPIILTIKIDGVERSYPVFGSFNKPSGNYSATGSTTSFDINTNGIGYAIVIHNTAGMAFVTDAGAICKTYSGTSVYGLPASKCKFADGILTIACTDTCINNTGKHYYQVL